MEERKYAVFDFDGTIVDAMPVYFDVSAHITGMPINELFENFLRGHGKATDKVRNNINAFFELVNKRDFPLIDGAREAIEKTYAKGFDLFISTGSQTEKTKERLEKDGLLNYFSLVYGSSEIEKGPEHIENFARFSNVSMEHFAKSSFFLGDGPGDMKLAKRCSMKAVGVAHTFDPQHLFDAGADIVLARIKDAGNAELI